MTRIKSEYFADAECKDASRGMKGQEGQVVKLIEKDEMNLKEEQVRFVSQPGLPKDRRRRVWEIGLLLGLAGSRFWPGAALFSARSTL
jgi:hypothetical protein